MLVLFDQGTPIGIRQSLREHTVRTASEQGWSTLLNGQLLRAAEEAGFDVLLTTDNSLPFQQKLEGRKLALVILSKNRWKLIRRVLPEIAAAVAATEPGSCTVVEIPEAQVNQVRKVYGFTFSAEVLSGGNSQCSTHLEAKNSISTFLCFIFPMSSGATIRDCGPSARLKVH
jgi:hypothetical protein